MQFTLLCTQIFQINRCDSSGRVNRWSNNDINQLQIQGFVYGKECYDGLCGPQEAGGSKQLVIHTLSAQGHQPPDVQWQFAFSLQISSSLLGSQLYLKPESSTLTSSQNSTMKWVGRGLAGLSVFFAFPAPLSPPTQQTIFRCRAFVATAFWGTSSFSE